MPNDWDGGKDEVTEKRIEKKINESSIGKSQESTKKTGRKAIEKQNDRNRRGES
jgi:hypothetical protein